MVRTSTKLAVANLEAKVSTIGSQVLIPGVPAEYVQVAHIVTDGPVGGSLYGGFQRQPTVLASAATLSLPISAVNENIEIYAVSGSAKVKTINTCWGNRTVRFIVTGTATFAPGGNITTITGNALGGTQGAVFTLFCDAITGAPAWRQMQ